MSVFPLALLNFGITERAVWAFCSSVAGIIWLGFILFILRNMNADKVAKPLRIFFAFLFVYSTATAAILFLNAFGIIFSQEFGPYFAGFLLTFFMVCFNFSRLLMHPLWKALRNQEAERTAVA